ncbi:MAG: dTDP-4-dehydrorhamnose 3,5-epimerase family protein, partial [Campylobacteraceae bacterium]|nr:dTDP-4-dehydrorhamnose 3,5-epimerase family protein [Campylobacteraceae bacterium]
MNILNTSIKDLLVLDLKPFNDKRGSFIKVFNNDFFINNNLQINIKEVYFSTSHKNVIRGMHFQTPPNEHTKIVFVT